MSELHAETEIVTIFRRIRVYIYIYEEKFINDYYLFGKLKHSVWCANYGSDFILVFLLVFWVPIVKF